MDWPYAKLTRRLAGFSRRIIKIWIKLMVNRKPMLHHLEFARCLGNSADGQDQTIQPSSEYHPILGKSGEDKWNFQG